MPIIQCSSAVAIFSHLFCGPGASEGTLRLHLASSGGATISPFLPVSTGDVCVRKIAGEGERKANLVFPDFMGQIIGRALPCFHLAALSTPTLFLLPFSIQSLPGVQCRGKGDGEVNTATGGGDRAEEGAAAVAVAPRAVSCTIS